MSIPLPEQGSERLKIGRGPFSPRIPVSTYRLQLGNRVTYHDAARLVPYLRDLGISDVYSSPYFMTPRGSGNAYEIVDPNVVNPGIGGEEGLDRFVSVLSALEMGYILDIVPNHMYIESRENAWWMDVLENGPSSQYADFFDIDWHPAKRGLENKVLIPILGEQYGIALERQELKLCHEDGAFFLDYYEHRLPIAPDAYTMVLTYRMERIRRLLPPDHPHLVELLSILTALGCLPAYTERDPDRIIERRREKETIKRRLLALYEESPEVRSFLDDNIIAFNGARDQPSSFNLLDELVGRQVWRLSYWRVATEEINYRRFFDINGLAAVRMEDPIVFLKAHQLILALVRKGRITGLRVDHPDGLRDPAEYFKKLQRECFIEVRAARAEKEAQPKEATDEITPEDSGRKEYEGILASDPQPRPFYVIGEKILMKSERMPEDWPVFGTTGYTFLNSLNGIFVDGTNARAFDEIYGRFTGAKPNYQDLVYEKKRLIMITAMSSEINRLGRYLGYLAEKNRHTRDYTSYSLTMVIREVIACFPIYRTYITGLGVDDRDRRYIEQAVGKAKRRNPALSETVFDFLLRVLLFDCPADFDEADKEEWVDFVMRFQQLSGPVMAKGLEDTVFYVYNRLLSLNEVGGNPERFGTPLDAFHGQNMETAKSWPHSLVATSTHDTKRSEDVRARLNVLSEIPDEWHRCLVRWRRFNSKKKTIADGRAVPDRNEEYLIYQTLLGIWPLRPAAGRRYTDLKNRMKEYVVKAVREAKVNSSWISPDPAYEEGLAKFLDVVLAGGADDPFVKDFKAFHDRMAYFGMVNSLSQTLLKITSPGVPDFYQGTELWDFSLADPDNRRPVDFRSREVLLKRLKEKQEKSLGNLRAMAKSILRTWKNGMVKLYVTWRSLEYRNRNRALFEEGDYTPLASEGRFGQNLCAFARRKNDRCVFVVVPRFVTRLVKSQGEPPLDKRVWEDSRIIIPDGFTEDVFRNVFTGETVEAIAYGERRILKPGDIFATFPVALLEEEKR